LATSSIYLAVLPKGVVSPLAKESDEEGQKKDDEEKKADDKKDAGPRTQDAGPIVKIDFDGLSQRIVAVPNGDAGYSDLSVGKTGEIYYLKTSSGQNRFSDDGGNLYRYSLKKRKEEQLVEKVNDYELSRDHKKVYLHMKDSFVIADVGDKVDATKNK